MATTTTQDYTAVSYTAGGHIEGVVLNVRRLYIRGGQQVAVKADAHGRLFPTLEDAKRFALEHGYLQPFIASPQLREMRRRAHVARMA